jgi:tellurite resistance protein
MGIENIQAALKDNPALAELAAQKQMLDQAAEHDRQQAKLDREIVLGALTESAYIVAVADGALSDTERSALVRGIGALSGGADDEIRELLDRVAPAVQEEGPSARFEEIAEVLEDGDLREAAYLVACAVAWHDGGIGEKQGLALRGLMKAFGYSEAKHQALLAKARQAV